MFGKFLGKFSSIKRLYRARFKDYLKGYKLKVNISKTQNT